MDDLPFLEELDNMTQENNKKPNIQYQIITSSDKKENNANSNKENDIIVNNTMELDENKEEAKENDLNEEKNKEPIDTEVKEASNHNPESYLGQKTKPSNEILDPDKMPTIDNNTSNSNAINNNNNNTNNNNEPAKEYPSLSVYNDENKKNEEYDYGYSIILMNDGESGLMEDFFKEKQNESTTSDYFNYHLDEEKWIKIFNHSILLHYERHLNELKAENEKKKKMQNMFNNANNNNGNPQMMTQMNPMMFMNMGNGVNYPAQMYLKNIQMQHNYPK